MKLGLYFFGLANIWTITTFFTDDKGPLFVALIYFIVAIPAIFMGIDIK